MPDPQLPVGDLLALLPDAALLLEQSRVIYCNPPAQRLFLGLKTGDEMPLALADILVGLTAPATAQCELLDQAYQVTVQETPAGNLVLLRLLPGQSDAPRLSRVAQHLRQDTASLSAVLQQLPLRDIVSAKEHQYVSMANQSLYRLHRLADQLDFASRSDQELYRPAPVDLAGLCGDVADQLQGVCQPEVWQFTYASECFSLLTMGDAVLLQRLLFALISNSIKAIPAGGKLGMTLARMGNRAILTIWDQGHGQTDPGQLFTTLARNPPSLNPEEGVGLGLSAVRRIVSLHKGTMVFEHPPEGGLRCTIALPIEDIKGGTPLRSPTPDHFGGLSPLLLELSDVLSWEQYTPESWEL